MRVTLADRGVMFDGLAARERPLGGAESAFVALAEALASEGAQVTALARGARALTERGVIWRDVNAVWPSRADLFVANRSPDLLMRPTKARRTAFWLHNPAQFLAKPRYLAPLLLSRATLIFAGPSHEATAPRWLSALPRKIIPLGVERVFLEVERASVPPAPVAIFTSNPLRGLIPLCALWRNHVRPAAPTAELHVISGPAVYGGGAKAAEMEAALAVARSLSDHGVLVRPPLPKAELAVALAGARAMLYLGDPGETFCLAVAEAQAAGAPAVVKPVGAVAERVIDGETGFVAESDADFAANAVALLTDDALWRRQSAAALAKRPEQDWARAARAFASLALESRAGKA